MTDIQPMPDLTPEQYDALRADIAEHGVQVPVTKDQHGRVLDGNNRVAIAAELGITDVPTVVRHVAGDDEAHDIAVTLNCARRHLNQEQTRELIRHELHRRSSDSDRAVARRVGCSPTTVGTIRKEMRAEAEVRTQDIRDEISRAATSAGRGAVDIVRLGGDIHGIIERAERARDAANARMRSLSQQEQAEQVTDTDAWAKAVLVSYVFTTLHNDLSDVAADLESAGWDGCPKSVPQQQLETLTDQLFALSNLDTAVIGGAR